MTPTFQTDEHLCEHCGKPTGDVSRWICSWSCHIELAVAQGGTKHQPNGLPITSIMADGSMWEHEHADHTDYKFPVKVEFVGDLKTARERPEVELAIYGRELSEDEARIALGQTHALIYTDGHVALTMYEQTYALWDRSGMVMGDHGIWKPREWRLTDDSVAAIRAYNEKAAK